MTVLRVTGSADAPVGSALGAVGSVVLTRREDRSYIEVASPDVQRLVRALAYAGVTSVTCDDHIAPPAGSIPALGRDLVPLSPDLVHLDTVRVERVALGHATTEVLARRMRGLLPPPAAARARCRALLRGDAVLLAWSRRAWGSRATFRGPGARSLRPIVFDREAARRVELRGRAWSTDGDLGRWLFG